jgi:hypothetical protein
LGTNFLSKAGNKLNDAKGSMEWCDCSIPLCPPGGLGLKGFHTMEDVVHIQVKDELLGLCHDWLQCLVMTILDAKYEWTDIPEFVNKLLHLNAHQKADLLQVLHDTEEMFDGTLQDYP